MPRNEFMNHDAPDEETQTVPQDGKDYNWGTSVGEELIRALHKQAEAGSTTARHQLELLVEGPGGVR